MDKMTELVETNWLKENLNNPEVKIIDGSWYMPGSGLNATEIFKKQHIPNSIFIDLEEISDQNSDLPHMMPTENNFSKKISSYEIKNDDQLIIYDAHGIFSAARIWFAFKAFGHKKVSILNGGFPAWIDSGGKISDQINNLEPTNYQAKLNNSLIVSYKEIFNNLSKNKYQIIDARSPDRFSGLAEEPRPGMKLGHIPNSKNLYFNDLIDPNTKKFIEKEEIEKLINNQGIDLSKDTVCSCGSGVTACILKFALELLGKNQNIRIYDGSWSDWGTREDSPCERN
ncbi:MAG: 3-mercaptopyruvate sulfurtransferase [Alphaproteobacteria bacterium MarineAlpha6_Bin2]|nr:MAG: 3-mercaptopyruvate sulfurtransferase [Alphaproteobacteria bacterium MarineAlpha6_Bin2]